MSERDRLIEILRHDGIRDERVLGAIARVPREQFIAPEIREMAYCNEALPIESGQTISQPFIVALMSAALELVGDERVLDVGTGSGYQAAILSLLCRQVVSVERHADLARDAVQRLTQLGYENVEVHIANDRLGWPAGQPYDGILCAAAAPRIPAALVAQLAPAAGARLVIPVGSRDDQELLVVRREAGGFVEKRLGPVRFVPLIGLDAWDL